VAAYLGLRGSIMLYDISVHLPEAWRHPNNLSYPVDYFNVAFALLIMASALGVLKWRKWAHASAIAFTALEMIIAIALLFILGPFGMAIGVALSDVRFPLLLLLDLPAFAWLLLPDVRSAYWQPRMAA